MGNVELGEEEKMIARYPPTMSLMPKLTKESFYNDVEQLFSKVRMELSSRDSDQVDKTQVEMRGDLTPEEIELAELHLLAEARQEEVFSHQHRTLDMSKMSVNNTSRNSGITLPSQADNAKEAGLSMRRSEWDLSHSQALQKTKNGVQASNLHLRELKGYKKLNKGKAEGLYTIAQTDKSNKLPADGPGPHLQGHQDLHG